MESISFSLSPTTIFTVLTILLSLYLCILWLIRFWRSSDTSGSGHRKRTVPEASGWWPLLGHLPLLAGSVPPHLVLAKLADRCGPIFTVRLGFHRAVVVSSWEIAKECLTTHDRTFATRPKSVNSEVLACNYAMFAFTPYGPYWRYIRKISTAGLLSSHRLELFKHVRESEVHAAVKEAYNKSNINKTTLDMKMWFEDITVNIIFRMIIGKQLDDGQVEEKRIKQALRDWFELMGRFVVSDALPLLRWLDIGGYERAMRKTMKELDEMVQRWLDEHKIRKGDDEKRHDQEDFMDVLLSTLNKDTEEIRTYDVDAVIKATCMTMVLAGSDATAVSLIWALSLLLNHKEPLRKIQQELDTNIGREKQVQESDLKNLPYLQAVIKETMRLYPAGPLGVPHEAIEDCTLQGHFVSKGTRLLLNIYKIQRDSRVWSDPNKFKPERFLTTCKELDVKGQNYELMPFGSGRRMCVGIPLALPIMGLSLASFLQAFEVRTVGDELVDMTEAIGLSNLKATPLEVLIKPRLPEFMYR